MLWEFLLSSGSGGLGPSLPPHSPLVSISVVLWSGVCIVCNVMCVCVGWGEDGRGLPHRKGRTKLTYHTGKEKPDDWSTGAYSRILPYVWPSGWEAPPPFPLKNYD